MLPPFRNQVTGVMKKSSSICHQPTSHLGGPEQGPGLLKHKSLGTGPSSVQWEKDSFTSLCITTPDLFMRTPLSGPGDPSPYPRGLLPWCTGLSIRIPWGHQTSVQSATPLSEQEGQEKSVGEMLEPGLRQAFCHRGLFTFSKSTTYLEIEIRAVVLGVSWTRKNHLKLCL